MTLVWSQACTCNQLSFLDVTKYIRHILHHKSATFLCYFLKARRSSAKLDFSDHWASCLWARVARWTTSSIPITKRILRNVNFMQKEIVCTHLVEDRPVDELTLCDIGPNLPRPGPSLFVRLYPRERYREMLTFLPSISAYTWSAVVLIYCNFFVKWDFCGENPSKGRRYFARIFLQLYHLTDVDEMV